MAVTLVNTDTVFDDATLLLNGAAGVTSVILNGLPYLYVSGFTDSGISAFTISASGQLSNVMPGGNIHDNGNSAGNTAIGGPSGLTTVTVGGNAFLCATGHTENGISSIALNPANGAMSPFANLAHNRRDSDSGNLQLFGAVDAVAATVGGATYLYVAGLLDNGISTFNVSPSGELTAGSGANFHWSDPSEGSGVHNHEGLEGARALATANIGGTPYLFVAAQGDSAIGVFTIDVSGALTPRQTIRDQNSATFRIGGAAAIATGLVGDKTYVFVGGTEDGISVFIQPPNGPLSNVFNIADNATLHLDNVFDLVTANIAGTTYLFAAGFDDDGVSVFAVAADGSLVNVANVVDTGTLALNAANQLSTVVIGGKTFLAVTGFVDNGVSLFRVDTTGLTITGTAVNDTVDATHAPPGQLLPGSLGDTISGLGGNDALSGLDGNDRLDGGIGTDTLNGGAGNDTFVIDSTTDTLLDPSGIDTVESTVTKVLNADLEHLTLLGTGAISGTGNALANTITGNTAANILDGGAGADRLIGGGGNDTYVTDGADVVVDASGTDTVASNTTRSLASFATVENLTLLGTAAINGTGNALANTITGNGAANILDGGAGLDILNGGAGNDTYVLSNGFDKITDTAGIDTVTSTINRSLATLTTIEKLILLGTAAMGTGNGLANTIIGNGANNKLSGGGGADKLQGLGGNDIYTAESAGDVVIEVAGGGIDLIQSSITRTLEANVEKLTLTGTALINGTGNALANTITGNGAANILDGGAGLDILNGGAGNDTYVLSNGFDKVTDTAGIDTVTSTINRSLATLTSIENLILLGTAATGTGNGLANTITGNSSRNKLIGGGGGDKLQGLAGDDIYAEVAAGDVVIEAVGGGNDLIQSKITRGLEANVEKLTLIGTAAINGTGNALANEITGNTAANILNGGAGADRLIGGVGKDTMTGGTGPDVFDFNAVTDMGKTAATRDVIKDFTHLADDIDLSTIDANGAAPGHAFTFLAANGAAFTGVAGQLRWFTQGTGASALTIVEGDINGNKVADFQIELTGAKTLTVGDFIL